MTKYYILITLILSTVLQGMERDQIVEYQSYCHTVKEVFERDKNDFCVMLYKKHLDPVQELARVEQHFVYHKNKLVKERNANLLCLKNYHNISDTSWEKIMKDLEQIKIEVKNHINTVLPHAQHDNILSGENKLFFAKHLKKYDLDIEKICIKKRDASGDSISAFVSVNKHQEDKSFSVSLNTPDIGINSRIFDRLTLAQQKANLSQLAWVMSNMCTINPIFLYLIAKKSNKNCDIVEESKEFQRFLKTERHTIATIFPCLEDYEACQCMEDFKTACLSPVVTFDQNKECFQEICTLKNLWEKRKILQEFVQK